MTATGFLSTSSARRTTYGGRARRNAPRHFYPRPPRGGRQAVVYSTQPKSPEEQAELAARAIEFAKQQDADGALPEITALPGVDAEALARFVRSVVRQELEEQRQQAGPPPSES